MAQDNYLTLLYMLLNEQQAGDEINTILYNFSNTDWEEFLEVVSQHNMLPTIYSPINRLAASDNIPLETLRLLKDYYLRTAARNALVMKEVERILTKFNQIKLPSIGLKGIYLVETIQEFFGARTFGDIDILVRKQDISKAIAILKNMGYEMMTYFNSHDVNIDIKHVPPMLKSEKLPVEIHWTLLEEDEPFSIDTKGLWERAVPARIAGVDILALSPEDLILHLSLHMGYQHHMSLGLRGLYDIAEVLHYFEGKINWEKLVEISHQWGSARVTWLMLTLAQDLLGAFVPGNVLKQLKPKNAETWVIEEAKSQLLNTRTRFSPMTPDLANLAEEKTTLGRFRLILSRVFLPRQTLARLYGVPPTSIRIYGCYFKRLVELIKHYRSSVTGILRKEEEVLQNANNQHMLSVLKSWLGEN